MKHLLVLGATSSIAQAFCRSHAPAGIQFWLLGRNETRLRAVAADLLARGAHSAEIRVVTPGDFGALSNAINEGFARHGRFDVFLATQGALTDQMSCEENPAQLAENFQINAVEVMQAALCVAPKFERQGDGVCVIIGSVAGDRGRRSNYVYGSAKAALETFCEGLRQRLEPAAWVLLVKPGPVDTPMTAQLQKNALFTTPEAVAASISKALRRRSAVVYTPFYWWGIMQVIRWLPRRLVKGLRA